MLVEKSEHPRSIFLLPISISEMKHMRFAIAQLFMLHRGDFEGEFMFDHGEDFVSVVEINAFVGVQFGLLGFL